MCLWLWSREGEIHNKKLINFTILKYKTFVAKDTINQVKRQAKMGETHLQHTYPLNFVVFPSWKQNLHGNTRLCLTEVKNKLWFLRAFLPSIFPTFSGSISLHTPVESAKFSQCSQEGTAERLTYRTCWTCGWNWLFISSFSLLPGRKTGLHSPGLLAVRCVHLRPRQWNVGTWSFFFCWLDTDEGANLEASAEVTDPDGRNLHPWLIVWKKVTQWSETPILDLWELEGIIFKRQDIF